MNNCHILMERSLISQGLDMQLLKVRGQGKKKSANHPPHFSMFSFQAAVDTRKEDLVMSLNPGPLGLEHVFFLLSF